MKLQAEFRRDIQGLRGLAVLSVVAFHAGSTWLKGGFVGVDIFFVISGFLITGILLRANAAGRFSIIEFYKRRIRRLYPALVVMLVCTLVSGYFLLAPEDYKELALTAVATVFFVSNFTFQQLSGYFDGPADFKPLLHTWSLAVEEQFYIFFPILLLLLRRYARKAIGLVLIAGLVASLTLSVVATELVPSAAFYLAPTRAYELLLGSLVAYFPHLLANTGRGVRETLSFVGLTLILGSIILIDQSMSFPGAIALIPCLGAALVIAAGQATRLFAGRLLGSSVLVFFGNISYSLYLWHWPMLTMAKHWLLGPLSVRVAVATVVSSVIIAWLSWRYVEQPFLTGFKRLATVQSGVAAMLAIAAISGFLFATGGLPGRFDMRSLALFAASEDHSPLRERCHSKAKPLSYEQNCVLGALGTVPSSAIWADSHGAELAVAISDRLISRGAAVMQITASGCPPIQGFSYRIRPLCATHNARTLAALKADSRIKTVLMLANFQVYPIGLRTTLAAGYRQSVKGLVAAGKRVVLFEPIPVAGYNPPAALGIIVARGGNPTAWGIGRRRHDELNSFFRSLIAMTAAETGAVVIHTADLLCDPDLCPAYSTSEGYPCGDGRLARMG